MSISHNRLFAVLSFPITALTFSMPSFAGTLNCPDTPDAVHVRDVMATSAPEIKVRSASKEDGKRWSELTRPLVVKAIKQAKTQRSDLIQEGVEQGCTTPQIYVAQIVPASAKPSGCDHRIVTRPADEGMIYVQAIATCKFAWACCTPDEVKAGESTPGYKLEGPLNPNAPRSSAASQQPASDASTSAPTKPKP
jgi:hypothetical protein